MAMDFYFKDMYGSGSLIQTTEDTVPDETDTAEIVEDSKAANKADEAKGTTANKKTVFAAFLVVVCLAIFMGGRK